MVEQKKVKVGIQITDDEGGRFPREWLWARVVQEGKAGGVYCQVEFAMFLADPTDSPDHPVFRQLVA